jgi:hypothetical protein
MFTRSSVAMHTPVRRWLTKRKQVLKNKVSKVKNSTLALVLTQKVKKRKYNFTDKELYCYKAI